MKSDFSQSWLYPRINPWPYLQVFGGIILTTVILILLRRWISPVSIALLFLLPIGFGAAYRGLGPGLLAAFSAFLIFNYFFIDPLYTFLVHQTQDLIGLFVFLSIAFALSQGFGMARKNLEEAHAREREAIRFSELSSEMTGLQDDRAILQSLERKIQETFQAQRVEVLLEPQIQTGFLESEESNLRVDVESKNPSNAPASPQKLPRPDVLIPLQTVRGLIGEIRIWRSFPRFAPTEERLLQAFANQACLALERSHLSQAENRAKVLEESDRLKSSLLSSVSHELRTPISTIKASVTALRSETDALDPESRKELLAAIEEEIDHLNLLVGNLLDMSRIESGVLQPRRAWNVLAEIVEGVLHRLHSDLRRHTIQVDISEDLPLVFVDYLQLEQVFTNLISNSIKYSPPGTIILVTAMPQNDQSIIVQVKNQGPTVPKEHLEKIFDKFFRVTEADRITGTGLGLSICKGIVQAHGGRIWADNLSDGFSYFFTLPVTWVGDPLEEEMIE